MTTTNIALACRCGALRGEVVGHAPGLGNRGICLCDDCQAYAHYLGRAADVLDANGGTEVVPVAPARLKITAGIEHLKCLRLIDTGMLRWYAGCCRTPIANTTPSAKFPFAGLVRTILSADSKVLDTAFGPVRARVQGRYGKGMLPPETHQKGSIRFNLRTMRFLLVGALNRQAKPSPFFDAGTGRPVVEPYVLTHAEREALRPLCGPETTR